MLFGDAVINSERLTVPHYDMKTAALCSGRCSRSPRTFTFLTAALRAVLDNLGAEKPASW